MKKRAFTLAEVLITLTIIGVIAALTIPNLIAKHDATTLKSQFNKSYGALQNAVKQMQADYPDFIDELDSLCKTNEAQATSLLGERLTQYLKVKSFNSSTWDSINYYSTKYGKRSAFRWCMYGDYTLEDGSRVCVQTNTAKTFYIAIDVNGEQQRPNRAGIDTFFFQLDRNYKLESATFFESSCDIGGENGGFSGFGCAKQAITDPDYFKNLFK